MSRAGRYDLAIVGAGPAGAHAAIEACSAGLSVAVIDEADKAGGQIYRAPLDRDGSTKPDRVAGDAMRETLAGCGADLLFARRVWLIEQGFKIHTLTPDGPESFKADRLVLATGTSERVIPFQGWTTPGVIGLAAATILLKANATLPGKRTLVAGKGPLLYAVAAGIIEAGGEVAAVVDQASPADWLHAMPGMLGRSDLLARGVGWFWTLLSNRVTIVHKRRIAAVGSEGDDLLASLDNGRQISCDAVAVGHGLVPSTEFTRLLRAEHVFDASLGGWVPKLDEHGRSSIDGLYVCGDGAGVRGAAAAIEAGKLAGLAASFDAGRLAASRYETRGSAIRRDLLKARRFGQAIAHLTAPGSDDVAAIEPQTIVCRCEDVRRDTIDAAIDDGAFEINQLKAWTRCGMGPCQGRFCGPNITELMAARGLDRERIGMLTGRAPLRPMAVADLVGDFDYSDIPIPKAAPL